MDDPLVIAGKEFRSRLMVGTGRHRTMDEMVESIEASGAEIITVAIRRLNLDNPNEKSILDYFDWEQVHDPSQTLPPALPPKRPCSLPGWHGN